DGGPAAIPAFWAGMVGLRLSLLSGQGWWGAAIPAFWAGMGNFEVQDPECGPQSEPEAGAHPTAGGHTALGGEEFPVSPATGPATMSAAAAASMDQSVEVDVGGVELESMAMVAAAHFEGGGVESGDGHGDEKLGMTPDDTGEMTSIMNPLGASVDYHSTAAPLAVIVDVEGEDAEHAIELPPGQQDGRGVAPGEAEGAIPVDDISQSAQAADDVDSDMAPPAHLDVRLDKLLESDEEEEEASRRSMDLAPVREEDAGDVDPDIRLPHLRSMSEFSVHSNSSFQDEQVPQRISAEAAPQMLKTMSTVLRSGGADAVTGGEGSTGRAPADVADAGSSGTGADQRATPLSGTEGTQLEILRESDEEDELRRDSGGDGEGAEAGRKLSHLRSLSEFSVHSNSSFSEDRSPSISAQPEPQMLKTMSTVLRSGGAGAVTGGEGSTERAPGSAEEEQRPAGIEEGGEEEDIVLPLPHEMGLAMPAAAMAFSVNSGFSMHSHGGAPPPAASQDLGSLDLGSEYSAFQDSRSQPSAWNETASQHSIYKNAQSGALPMMADAGSRGTAVAAEMGDNQGMHTSTCLQPNPLSQGTALPSPAGAQGLTAEPAQRPPRGAGTVGDAGAEEDAGDATQQVKRLHLPPDEGAEPHSTASDLLGAGKESGDPLHDPNSSKGDKAGDASGTHATSADSRPGGTHSGSPRQSSGPAASESPQPFHVADTDSGPRPGVHLGDAHPVLSAAAATKPAPQAGGPQEPGPAGAAEAAMRSASPRFTQEAVAMDGTTARDTRVDLDHACAEDADPFAGDSTLISDNVGEMGAEAAEIDDPTQSPPSRGAKGGGCDDAPGEAAVDDTVGNPSGASAAGGTEGAQTAGGTDEKEAWLQQISKGADEAIQSLFELYEV
ncbi:hypothetical protein CYMTET_46206, partial [Cymbomonas tetramitiformis]